MTDIDQMAKWLKQAKQLLNVLEVTKKKDLKESTNAIATLLKNFKAQFGKQIEGFEKKFEQLAREADESANDKKKKKTYSVQKLNENLAKLQLEIELKIGESNPVATPEIRKRMLEETRHKPVYLDKRTRVEEAIAELERLPGAAGAVGKLRELISAAKLLEPDYEAAYGALDGLSGYLAEGRKAAENFAREVGGKEFELALNNARTALEEFEKACGLGQPEEVAKPRAFIDRLLSKIAQLKGKERALEVEVAKKDLTTLAEELREAVKTEEAQVELMTLRMKSVSHNLTRLNDFAPVDVYSSHLANFRVASTLLGQRRLEEATEKIDKIETVIEGAANVHEKLKKEWAQVESAIGKLDLAVLQALPTFDTKHYKDCQILRDLWREILAKHVKARQYETAIEQSKKIEEEMTAALAPKRRFDASFEHVTETWQKRLAAYREQMNILADLGGDPGKYKSIEEQHTASFNELKDRLQKSKPEDFEAALKSLNEEADKAIKALTVDLPLEEDDKQRLEKAKSVESEVNKLSVDIRAKLKYLHGYGIASDPTISDDPKLESLQNQFTSLSNQPTKNEKVVKDLNELLDKAKNKISSIEDQLKIRRADALDKANTITKGIAELRTNQDKRYGSFFDALQDEVDESRLMSQGTVVELMMKGEQELKRLEIDFNKHKSEFGTKNGLNFASVESEYDKIFKEVDTEDHKTYHPTLRKVLKTELEKALKPKLASLSPSEALKALQEFRTHRLQLLTQGAKDAKEKADQITSRIDSVRVELKKLKGLTPKPETLITSLEQRLDSTAKRPKSDAQGTWLELDSIQGLIKIASQSKEKAAELDQRVMKLEFEAERDKLKYEAALDVFEKNTRRRVESLRKDVGKSESNEDLYDQIDVALAASKKQAKKGEIGLVLEQLRLAEAAANSYLQHPYGAAGVGRRELAGAEKKWMAVAAEFGKQAGALIVQVQAQQSDQDFVAADGRQALVALEPLRTLLNPQIFASFVTTLSDAPPTEVTELGKRRAIKERAIAIVRRYQRALAEHVLIPAARDNPFGVAFPSQQQMDSALRALEGALVAC